MLQPIDAENLADTYQSASPFPHMLFEQFLDLDFARKLERAYPSFEEASRMGREFSAVNERRKLQVTDFEKFPEDVKQLARCLADPEFIRKLEVISGIPNLIWDDGFAGGGMHQTASSGHLDVHVDFNFNESLQLHRRLNLLIYLNEGWDPAWGGAVELWDAQVQRCHLSVLPELSRALLFTTSDISYHGVTSVSCPEGKTRKSFAVYYYTKEAPPEYRGENHSTIFKARPNELRKKYVDMPREQIRARLKENLQTLKGIAKTVLGREQR